MNAMQPYPSYRDSGVEWLGEVPEHWEVRRLKSLLDNIVDSAALQERGEIKLALEHVESWTGRIRSTAAAAGFDGQGKCFRAGDILFGKLRPYLAKVTRPKRGGACVGEFLVLRPAQSDVGAPYMEHFLRSKKVIDTVNSSTFGARMPRADWTFVGGLPACLPTPVEQTAIALFLDDADRRIRRYIRAKERLIELLEEERRATIHEAVTGRIDVRTGRPYPAYKDSGVEWLGEVPEHWERRRLKTLLRAVDRRSSTGEETLLSLRRDHGVVIYSEHFARPPQGGTLIGYKQLAVGQLVVNRLQANNGLVFCSGVDGLVSPDYSVFDKTAPLQMKYMSDLLRTSAYRSHFRRVSTGLGTGTAGFLRLYDDVFLSTPVSLPREDEQISILAYLDAADRRASARRETLARQIDLLREYRTRLIADVVTGKLDVREAAANLPETAERDMMKEAIP